MAQSPEPGFLDSVAEAFRSELVKSIAGVVVAALLLLIKTVRTWLLDLVNVVLQPPRVDGKWETKIKRSAGAEEDHEIVELRQFGWRVWGTAKRKDRSASYKLWGNVFVDKLTLTYRDGDPHGNDIGAILLKVKTTGQLMEGIEIGCSLTDGSVESLVYTWTRLP